MVLVDSSHPDQYRRLPPQMRAPGIVAARHDGTRSDAVRHPRLMGWCEPRCARGRRVSRLRLHAQQKLGTMRSWPDSTKASTRRGTGSLAIFRSSSSRKRLRTLP